MKRDVYYRGFVELEPGDEPGNFGHCPIAHTTKQEDYVLSPRVSFKTIEFSHREDDMRYVFRTPARAKRFIVEADSYAKNPLSSPIPEPFWLELTHADLKSGRPRQQSSVSRAKRKSASSTPKKPGSRSYRFTPGVGQMGPAAA